MDDGAIVALEIGTSKVCALVGEAREDGQIMVTGIGQSPARGVRKGLVVDLETVVSCVRAAVHGAEQTGALEIRGLALAVSGAHVRSLINSGSVPVMEPEHGIAREEIEEAIKIAGAVNLPPDQVILHTVPQKYTVDHQRGIVNPEGMHGAKLSLDMLIVHGQRNALNNAVKAVESIGARVSDVVFSGLCSALAVLTPEQKECGVALLDLGGGTTSYVVYADGAIATAGVLAVGGDHVTNDLAQAFSLSLRRAETLKCESGSALPDTGTHFQRIEVPSEVGFAACSVPVSDLNAVIHARLDETLTLVRHELERKSVNRQLGAGIVLTGGGAHLRHVNALAERVLEMPCALGKPRHYSGMASAYEGPEYATPLGLIRYAVRAAAQRPAEANSLGGWLKKIFGGDAT